MHHGLSFGGLSGKQINRECLKSNARQVVEHVDMTILVQFLPEYRLEGPVQILREVH